MFGLFKKKSDVTPPGGNGGSGPDFSHVDSREKAQALSDQGVLAPLLLLPPMFGGEEVLPNIVFVPPWVIELKDRTDQNVIMPLVQDGKITRYTATPVYEGKSHVPTAIEIKAYEPGSFTQTLNIWGIPVSA